MLEGKSIKDDPFKRMQGSEVGLEWLEADEDAMREPIVIEVPEGLGMKMPPKSLTVDEVAEIVGEETPVEVIGAAFDVDLSHGCNLIHEPHRRRYPIQSPRLDPSQVGRIL